ncbi:hypothetical protein [Sedimentitalea nanhaiensis]|uniref:Hpt domain-containing protein n=1 Tax=Sedimentitalea nanhaiensis TaxID=999627 RepID=A0A1I7CT79_9RHOB|nr:hypothetical protein [Sedimentitalea nanhaiensis]SFU02622.1 hypothetical protein SAMN05216236_11964 [Sedimentitalea nanhaiensis]
MTLVATLVQTETVRLNQDQLAALYQQLGHTGAEDVVCRAIEELAVRLSHCERLWREKDNAALRKSARSLIAISEQIGMNTLARVAGDVTGAVDAGDSAAVAATLFRLIRIGERSLTAVWDLQDLSV